MYNLGVVNKTYLTVVIPCYNEMANLQKGVLDKIENYLSRQKYSYEVIIADDGSDDGSTEFVEKFSKENKNFKLIKNNHMGKAGAVASGMLKGIGEVRLFTDMDQATPIEEIEKLLPFFSEGFDVVIGSRNTRRKGSPLTRRIMSRSMIVLRKLLVGIYDVHDTQCGFKAFNSSSADKLFKKLNDLHGGYSMIKGSNVTAGFDVELLYIANKLGFKIKEVSVEWLYVETRRVSPIKDSFNGLADLIKISSNKFKGKYKV